MSLSQFHDVPNSPNMQKILQPISTNRIINSPDPDSCKENRSINLISKKSSAKKVNEIVELGFNEEMEMIEREIDRLSSRLEELRLKKASLVQKPGRIVPSKFMEVKSFLTPESDKLRCRGVSLGPLEIQNSCNKSAKKTNLKKIEEIKEEGENSNLRNDKLRPRGVSLGPLEIQDGLTSGKKPSLKNLEETKEEKGGNSNLRNDKLRRRGESLGPLEIQNSLNKSAKNTNFKKLEEIKEEEEIKKLPNQNSNFRNDKSRRRSESLGPQEIQNSFKCAKKPNLKKFEEIKEEKGSNLRNDKSRRRGESLGPLEIQNSFNKSAKKPNFKKLEEIKEATGSKKTTRGMSLGPLEISSVTKTACKQNPLKTEKKGSTSAISKPSLGKSRVVPSRYSLVPVKINIRDEPNSERRKWSLPGEETEEDLGTNSINETPQSISKIATLLPKIKAVRVTLQSPRDSGRAKRVADLEGKKPFFSTKGVSSYKERAF